MGHVALGRFTALGLLVGNKMCSNLQRQLLLVNNKHTPEVQCKRIEACNQHAHVQALSKLPFHAASDASLTCQCLVFKYAFTPGS